MMIHELYLNQIVSVSVVWPRPLSDILAAILKQVDYNISHHGLLKFLLLKRISSLQFPPTVVYNRTRRKLIKIFYNIPSCALTRALQGVCV